MRTTHRKRVLILLSACLAAGTEVRVLSAQSYEAADGGSYELRDGTLMVDTMVIGGGGPALFIHSGGINKISSVLEVGTRSEGTYQLSGMGLLIAPLEIIGSSSTSGLFQQAGGTNTVGTLKIASKGRYELSGGALNIKTALDLQGGSFAITGPSALSLASGMLDFANVASLATDKLSFNGGDSVLVILPRGLDVSTGFSSFANAGVTHTTGNRLIIPAGKTISGGGNILDPVTVAGTLTAVNGALWLKNGAFVSGTVSLNGGGLTVEDTTSGIGGGRISGGSEYVGYSGTGVFTQAGGTNDLGSCDLYLGYNPGASGTYRLQSGQLKANGQYIGYNGSGLFEQSGGVNMLTSLVIGKAGRYRLSGGEISISSSLIAEGAFEVGGPASLSVGGGITNFARGAYTGLHQLAFSGGTDALVILPQGSDPATLFASYSNSGLTHIAGGTLSIPAGKTITGAGAIDDHVDLAGSLLTSSGSAINLNRGVSLSGAASLNVGNGTITIDDTTSGMSGGQLTTSASAPFYVGKSTDGRFDQSGGVVTIGKLCLGAGSGTAGTYVLSGTAQLKAADEHIGESGSGHFVQSGGSNALQSNSVYLGYNAGASGSYELTSGTLKALQAYVGYNGAGEFNQSGGANTSSVYVGYNGGSRGTYTMTGGTLTGSVNVGAKDAAGTFTQNGGAVNGAVSVSPLGSYSLAGSGAITASASTIEGSFEHSAGTHTIDGSLNVGKSGSNALYHLSGTGLLSAQSEDIFADSRTSVACFIQEGGTNTVSGTLNIASSSDLSTGAYTLAAGQLSAANEVVYGLFEHRGGANAVGSLSIKPGGSYTMSGGTLAIDGSLSNEGTLDLSGGQADFWMRGGILDFSRGKLVSASVLAISGSDNSLIILPAGSDPAAMFRSFANNGITHIRGNALTIPAGRSIVGSGTIDDFVTVSGSLAASTNGSLNLVRGIYVVSGGSAALGVGSLRVNDANSGIGGGLLAGGTMYVGDSSAGTFTQSGGTVTFDGQHIGSSSSAGVYRLSGGMLSSNHLTIGGQQPGLLEQSGGGVSTGILSISAAGVYRLSAGTLDLGDGLDNQGLFEVTGPARLDINGGLVNLARGQIINPQKLSVTLSSGALLIVPPGFDPAVGFASFSSTGRVHTAGNTLAIPAGRRFKLGGQIDDHVDLAGSLSTSSGNSLTLSKGLSLSGRASASITYLSVDDAISGMSDGTLSATMMKVGDRGEGTFALSGGSLNTANLVVGSAGAGRFTQSGGIATASTLSINPTGSLILSGGALQVSSSTTVNGGSVSWQAGQFSTRSLTLDGGAMELSPGGDKLLKLTSLTLVNSATLDLADNAMILQPDTASPQELLELISAQIGAARNAERLWQGPGISSSTAREDASGLYGLAAILNRDSQGKPVYSIFQGQAVDANSILIMYTLNGDADLNGKLDGSDYFFIDKGFLSRNSANPPGGYRNGDFDYNGTIDGSDYFLIDKVFLSTHAAIASTPSGVVPEPDTLALLLTSAALALPRRRRPTRKM